jgi:hypothetical protein
MKQSLFRSFAAIFAIVMGLSFFAAPSEADAFKIQIKVNPGVWEKGRCVSGFGICSITIIIDLRASGGAAGDNSVSLSGNAEVAGDNLVVTLSERPGKELSNADGIYIFPVRKPIKLDGPEIQALGYQKIVIEAGDYELSGNKIKFKISEKTKIKKDKDKGNNRDE